jgi:hypothetical protein
MFSEVFYQAQRICYELEIGTEDLSPHEEVVPAFLKTKPRH